MIFNYDWWFGGGFAQQVEEAKRRCARGRFPNAGEEQLDQDAEIQQFLNAVEARIVVYLRDGFSYEMKEPVPRSDTVRLTFECLPADESYRVGSFVVSVPYDEVARVEVFAVHEAEKPEDMPMIKGFSGMQPQQGMPSKRAEERQGRRDREPVPADAESSISN